MAWWISRPVAAVADFAVRLAESQNAGPPPEPKGCLEARQLTVALAALQSRLETKMDESCPVLLAPPEVGAVPRLAPAADAASQDGRSK
jgi:hypothetical protein